MSDDGGEQLTLSGEAVTYVVNQKYDEYEIDIGRANGGESHMNNTDPGEPGWIGNPYPKSEYGREECIERFRRDFVLHIERTPGFREEVEDLRGKILGCYCKPKACHGDVIVEYLDGGLEALKDGEER